jgi:ethanolaminephosphotransferase
MLIDAMRVDFAFDLENKPRMPYLNNLFKKNKAIPFKLNSRPPTVTLPRLKSIVSGIVPEFIDILWNFNTTHLIEDNIIKQMRSKNKSIVFYGDDTWLKLFSSDHFLRYEGVSSFVASDYDQVDENVTRNLMHELKQNDWDLMILHYLGLDHVGKFKTCLQYNLFLFIIMILKLNKDTWKDLSLKSQ